MRIIILLSILFFSMGARAQQSTDYQEVLSAQLEKYFEHSNQGEWDRMLDMVYPGLFSITPREKIRAAFENLNNWKIKMTVTDLDIKDISEVFAFANSDYVLLKYVASIEVKPLEYTSFDDRMQNILYMQFATQFGMENVSYQADTKIFTINNVGKILAIKENGRSDWSLLELKPGMESVLGSILKKQVIDYFKLL